MGGGDDLGDESFLVEEIFDEDDDNNNEPLQKRRKREQTPEQILIETGRRLHELAPSEQAAFLNTAVKHFGLKEKGSEESGGLASASLDTGKTLFQENWLLPRNSGDEGLKGDIRSVVSMKKLKRWKGASPCVVSLRSLCWAL